MKALVRYVWVLQGNCTAPPSASFMAALSTGPPMLPRSPGQCVVESDAPVIYARHGSMLLDNVYIRRWQGAVWSRSALVQVQEGRWFTWQQRVKLWMARVTLQVCFMSECCLRVFTGTWYTCLT